MKRTYQRLLNKTVTKVEINDVKDLSIIFDNKYEFQVKCALDPNNNLGKQYNYTLVISDNKYSITSKLDTTVAPYVPEPE
jgi:hypothetical protein